MQAMIVSLEAVKKKKKTIKLYTDYIYRILLI